MEDRSALDGASARTNSWSIALISVVFLALASQMFALMSRHSVNLLVTDHWEVYRPIFENRGLWDIFRWTHGPARQGFGLVGTALLAGWTDMDTRAESFGVGVILCLAAVCALYLKTRLIGKITPLDAVIPMMFFSIAQYESWISVPFLSYGAVPILLLMLYCLGWLIVSPLTRTLVVSGLNFLLIHSVWGLFAAPLTTALFARWMIHAGRSNPRERFSAAAGFAASLVTIAVFLYGFAPHSSVECFEIRSWEHLFAPAFMSLMYAAFAGLSFGKMGSWASAGGAVFLFGLLGVIVHHGRRLINVTAEPDQVSRGIFILASFTLLFSVAASIGRLCLALGAAQSSRYMTLLIPGFLSVYFSILLVKRRRLRWIASALLFLGVLAGALPRAEVLDFLAMETAEKKAWKECFLKSGDKKLCEEVTGYRIFPWGTDDVLDERLQYLKRNRLNLYRQQRHGHEPPLNVHSP